MVEVTRPELALARLLFLETPLQTQADLPATSRRLEIVSTYYGATTWAGQRHALRYTARRGEVITWSLGLPWVYSSMANGGVSGRDNLHLGATVAMLRGDRARARVGAELWMPFADEALAPLALRRAFGRLNFLGELGDPRSPVLRFALAHRRELKGIGPEYEGARWTDLASLSFRFTAIARESWTLFLEAGGARALDEKLSWGRSGAGLSWRWNEVWSAEFAAEMAFGDEALPERYDYLARLGISRTLSLPSDTPPLEPEALDDLEDLEDPDHPEPSDG